MTARIHFRGPLRYRLRSAAALTQSILEVSTRRATNGPRRPNWTWFVEVATELAKRQTLTAFQMAKENVREARLYLDSMVILSPELSETEITPEVQKRFSGSWFVAKNLGAENKESPVTVLYFHGGGYSFYPRAYSNFIALLTQVAKSRTFALDYRLSPEHRFPEQLDDALNAYGWLLDTRVAPDRLILAGDSAGANLVLALLQAVRDARLPLPALTIAISPPTDFEAELPEIESSGKSEIDWISKTMLEQWSKWFCDAAESRNPLVSPLWADLRGLPHIYIQAGRSEILYPSIQAFANRALEQDADVLLESWENMTHDFQIFGLDSPPSADALRRIGQVIDVRVRKQMNREAVKS